MGRPPDGFAPEVWRATIDALDERLEPAVRDFVRSQFQGASDLAFGFSQLARLRLGEEPDYAVPGVAAAYAFRYLPLRVACVLGAFALLPVQELPRRVLDLGSGSGATSIALSLLEPAHAIQLDAVEPSFEMRSFAARFPLHPLVTAQQVPGTLQDLAGGQLRLPRDGYDLVVMSASLFYGDLGRQPLVAWLGPTGARHPTVLGIEPQAKQIEMRALAADLDDAGGYDVAVVCCHDLPASIRQPEILPRTTALLNEYEPYMRVSPYLSADGRRLLGLPPYPVESWNARRTVSFLIARPHDCGGIGRPAPPSGVQDRRARASMVALLRRWLARLQGHIR